MNVILLNFIQQLLRRISTPGDIKMRASANNPSGWLECNGSSYAASLYPALFNEIGYSWGGSGANFNVPDFRGVVPRGWNHGATDSMSDPSIGARIARHGGAIGDNVGSYQMDASRDHDHTVSPVLTAPQNGAGYMNSPVLGILSDNGSVAHPESRSKNAYVMFLIKT